VLLFGMQTVNPLKQKDHLEHRFQMVDMVCPQGGKYQLCNGSLRGYNNYQTE